LCLFFSTRHFEDFVLALVETVDFDAFGDRTYMTFLGVPLAVAVFVTVLELHVYHLNLRRYFDDCVAVYPADFEVVWILSGYDF